MFGLLTGIIIGSVVANVAMEKAFGSIKNN